MHELLEILAARAGRQPDRVVLTSDGEAVDSAALWRRIDDMAGTCASLPPAVGILAPNGLDWVAACLALLRAGRRVVPIPEFFAPAQIAHVLGDAGIGHVLVGAPYAPFAGGLPAVWSVIGEPVAGAPRAPSAAELVVYTSGSTGRPKGVRHGPGQLMWSARALISATGATARDSFLSALPLALLLEAIGAVFAPLIVGGITHLARDLPRAALQADAALLRMRLESLRPSITILVPEMLRGLVATLQAEGAQAPDSLRFVAVGGAAVPAALAERSRELGIPVFEGYGLSECCSVVALNRPGDRAAGTVGRPLDGLEVTIEHGEIVVAGPSVMLGYLGGVAADGRWRTGDLGRFDAEGRLIVEGRRDNQIVTTLGRNVSPEWIEAMLVDDPSIARAVVLDLGEAHPVALLVPAAGQDGEFDDPGALGERLAALTARAPDYARPRRAILQSEAALKASGLLTANGRPRRDALAARFRVVAPTKADGPREPAMSFYDRLQQETASERDAFLAIPPLRRALKDGVPLGLYLDYLAEAYHHVKYTVRLLALALARTGEPDAIYREALIAYIDEEKGHEAWILDDIDALGGDAATVAASPPGIPCRAMVGYVHYAIEHVSPYAMLGMVHVLEGMSVALAETAARTIRSSLGAGAKGFSYLTSHGGLDKEHVVFFRSIVDSVAEPAAQAAIVETARVVYRLFGDMFRELGRALEPVATERADAA